MTNIHNAPADMRYYASLTDDDFRELAIEFRNEILDELRRREETQEATWEAIRDQNYARAELIFEAGQAQRQYEADVRAEAAREWSAPDRTHIPTWPYAR